MTKKENFASFQDEVPWKIIPQTFKDAIIVVLHLGYRHLWIDSLCIIQDDSLDWERESSKMADVYVNSVLTIYAARSTQANDGVFHKKFLPLDNSSDPHVLEQPRNLEEDLVKIKFRQPSRKSWDVYVRQHYHDFIDDHDLAMSRSALDKRAWAFQEMTLSTRILYFKEAELMWECKDAFECECGESALVSAEEQEYLKKCMDEIGFGSPSLFLPLDMGNDEELPESCTLLSFWSNVVFSYCSRLLTYQTDILPALSGVAKRLQRPSLGAYLAGMWEHQLPQSLCWRVRGDLEFADETFLERRENRVRRKYLAPSWSWASGPYSLDSGDWGQDPFVARCRILDYGCAPSGEDPTGRVSGGHITVAGRLLHLKFLKAPSYLDEKSRGTELSFDEDPFRLDLHIDDLADCWRAAPLRSLEGRRTKWKEQSVNWNMVELYLQLEDFALLQSLGEEATYALLRIGALPTQNESREYFYAILLKSSKSYPGSYERLGIVDGEGTYSATNSFYSKRAYEIMTEHFENARDATVTIV
jgi:hypothetical protein